MPDMCLCSDIRSLLTARNPIASGTANSRPFSAEWAVAAANRIANAVRFSDLVKLVVPYSNVFNTVFIDRNSKITDAALASAVPSTVIISERVRQSLILKVCRSLMSLCP